MRKPGELDLFLLSPRFVPTSFFGQPRQIPDIGGYEGPSEEEEETREAGKASMQSLVCYRGSFLFNKFLLTGHRSRSVVIPMFLPPT